MRGDDTTAYEFLTRLSPARTLPETSEGVAALVFAWTTLSAAFGANAADTFPTMTLRTAPGLVRALRSP